MHLFRYKLLSETGQIVSGVVELPLADLTAAVRYVEHDGGVALEVRALPGPVNTLAQFFKLGLSSFSRLELAEFYHNLGMLLGAGVTVLDGLDKIQEYAANRHLKAALRCIRADIQAGQTFSEALIKHPRLAPFVVQHMVAIGEEAGRLDQMLKKCGDHLLHLHEIVSATKRAMTYPAILLVVVLGAVVFWLWYVVPQLVSLFKDLGVELPLPTRMLIAASDWFQEWFGIVAILATVLVILLSILRRKVYAVRYALSYLSLRAPVISRIVHTSLVARATEYLGIMLGTSISVLRAMTMITEATGNEIYKKRLLGAQNSLQAGNLLSEALKQHQALDPFAIRMLSVGEMTGRLDSQATYVADLYREKLNGLVQVLSKTLEPLIMMVLGGLFAIIMIGLLMPVYDLMTAIGN